MLDCLCAYADTPFTRLKTVKTGQGVKAFSTRKTRGPDRQQNPPMCSKLDSFFGTRSGIIFNIAMCRKGVARNTTMTYVWFCSERLLSGKTERPPKAQPQFIRARGFADDRT